MENNKTFLGRIKDAVDLVYLLVTDAPDGYKDGFSTYNFLVKRVVSVLVGRKILHREDAGCNRKSGRCFIYKWTSNMAPTDHLYKVVMGDVRAKKRSENQKRYRNADKPNGLTPVSVVIEEAKEIPAPVIEQVLEAKKQYVVDLKRVPDQELWDELKRRGYSAEDSRLVKKEYLD